MDTRLAELRDTLLALYECARALDAHEIAYHALAGALHAAEQLHDEATLEVIESHARQHVSLMDASHRLSAQSAAERGHHSFEQLALLAGAARLRLKGERQIQQKGRPQAPSSERRLTG